MKSWKFILPGIVIMIMLILLSILYYYQGNYFNTNITVNRINVGGLTPEQALGKLQTTSLTNKVYIGELEIIDGTDTKMRFSEEDLPRFEELLEKQWTFFPSFKKKNYSLFPTRDDQYRSIILKYDLEQKLLSINKPLIAPVDSHAILKQGKISITKSVDGTKYDIKSLLSNYLMQQYTSDIYLDPFFSQPIREDSLTVKNEEKILKEFLQHTVNYQVQDQVFSLKANELIQDAFVSKDKKVVIDPIHIRTRVAEINASQSTLGKDFTFNTHSGSVIQVKGQGYGWALDIEKETALILDAFENGVGSLAASNIYGNGWSNEGYGYETLANGGIGGTYAEVSLKDQRLWLYKEGKVVFTTHVVTGNERTGQHTSKGVWYILYKRTPYTLTGTSPENPYSIKVNYWAPFTNSGQGFHDASWRSNWRGNAYHTAGSNGCVNIPPNVMKNVYQNVSVYQPVVIY
ncbi:L,D-transpeptidase family protein [Bacillus pinisoli]|uniref:L,D-transpeptidase family protein n=1 Tax=Bacillus pinisoli TaxID=2901866 RepID=UPI003AEF4D49